VALAAGRFLAGLIGNPLSKICSRSRHVSPCMAWPIQAATLADRAFRSNRETAKSTNERTGSAGFAGGRGDREPDLA